MIIKNITCIYLNGDFFFLCLSHLFLILGEGYRLGDGSMTNPKDSCYKCPNGTYNRGIIDTAKLDDIQLDVCDPIDCSCHGRLCPSLTLLYHIIFLYLFVIFISMHFDKNSYILQFIDMVEMLRICWVFMFSIYFFASINDLIFNIYIYYFFHFDKCMNFRWNHYWKWWQLWERWRKNMCMWQGKPVLWMGSFGMPKD